MSFLRYLMFLSLMVWIGGLIFFAFVLAPTVFNIPEVLPNTHLAGNVVGRALGKLHWIGIISGLVFLVSSLVYSCISAGTVEAFTARNVLICLMLTITLISQFGIVPGMDALRASLGEMTSTAKSGRTKMCPSGSFSSGSFPLAMNATSGIRTRPGC